jgi:hypothetical protein
MQFITLLVAVAFAAPNGLAAAAGAGVEKAEVKIAGAVEKATGNTFQSLGPWKKAAVVGASTVALAGAGYGGVKGFQKVRARMAEKKAAKLAAKDAAVDVNVVA